MKSEIVELPFSWELNCLIPANLNFETGNTGDNFWDGNGPKTITNSGGILISPGENKLTKQSQHFHSFSCYSIKHLNLQYLILTTDVFSNSVDFYAILPAKIIISSHKSA